jgi:hypothetical protein
MTILAGEDSQAIVSIFEIWPTFINTSTKSFSTKLGHPWFTPHMCFSPAMYWVSITSDVLVVLDIQNSKVLLLEEGFMASCLSPDGSLLVAFNEDEHTSVWKYYPEKGYTLWMKFPVWSEVKSNPSSFLFSPTLSSVLVLDGCSLEVKHLDNPRTTLPKNEFLHCEEFSTDGTYMVTVPYGEQIITITNLNGNYSQSINPGFSVYGLALTKNVLLVLGDYEITGWWLTEEIARYGASGGRVLDQDGRLWTISTQGEGPTILG